MSLLAAAAIGAGVGAAGNLLGSASQSAMGYYMSKRMAQYNYDLQKKGYLEFPTAQVAGLRAAGINPMVAYGGIAGAQAHAGNYQAAPGSDLGSSAINNYRENKKLDPALKNIQADTEAKYAQAGAAQAQAGAAADQGKASLINAMTNAKRVQAEVDLMKQQGSSIESRDPTKSGWGAVDRIIGAAGDVGTTIGGSAIAAKGIYDMVKDKNNRSDTVPPVQHFKKNGRKGTIVTYPNRVQEIKLDPKKPSVFSRAVNSAKKVAPYLWPVLAIGSKSLVGAGLGAGALYGGKKLMDVYDKSENAKKIKEHHTYQHGNWSR